MMKSTKCRMLYVSALPIDCVRSYGKKGRSTRSSMLFSTLAFSRPTLSGRHRCYDLESQCFFNIKSLLMQGGDCLIFQPPVVSEGVNEKGC